MPIRHRRRAKPFSVLLLYPDYVSDGPETFYAFVRADSPWDAAQRAQRTAARRLRAGEKPDPDDLRVLAEDFKVELVLRGHRRGLAWWREPGAKEAA